MNGFLQDANIQSNLKVLRSAWDMFVDLKFGGTAVMNEIEFTDALQEYRDGMETTHTKIGQLPLLVQFHMFLVETVNDMRKEAKVCEHTNLHSDPFVKGI